MLTVAVAERIMSRPRRPLALVGPYWPRNILEAVERLEPWRPFFRILFMLSPAVLHNNQRDIAVTMAVMAAMAFLCKNLGRTSRA